jgi:two-component system, response regulator
MPEGIAAIEILLVEDNASDVELALRAFKKNKLINSIQIVRDGEEALDYLLGKGNYAARDINQVPKLIITDLNMPKVNGIELLRQIKSVSLTRDIPVIVLTSSQEEQDIMETYRLGINSYMLKPVNFDQFVDSVRQIGFRWMLLPPEIPAAK